MEPNFNSKSGGTARGATGTSRPVADGSTAGALEPLGGKDGAYVRTDGTHSSGDVSGSAQNGHWTPGNKGFGAPNFHHGEGKGQGQAGDCNCTSDRMGGG